MISQPISEWKEGRMYVCVEGKLVWNRKLMEVMLEETLMCFFLIFYLQKAYTPLSQSIFEDIIYLGQCLSSYK